MQHVAQRLKDVAKSEATAFSETQQARIKSGIHRGLYKLFIDVSDTLMKADL